MTTNYIAWRSEKFNNMRKSVFISNDKIVGYDNRPT